MSQVPNNAVALTPAFARRLREHLRQRPESEQRSGNAAAWPFFLARLQLPQVQNTLAAGMPPTHWWAWRRVVPSLTAADGFADYGDGTVTSGSASTALALAGTCAGGDVVMLLFSGYGDDGSPRYVVVGGASGGVPFPAVVGDPNGGAASGTWPWAELSWCCPGWHAGVGTAPGSAPRRTGTGAVKLNIYDPDPITGQTVLMFEVRDQGPEFKLLYYYVPLTQHPPLGDVATTVSVVTGMSISGKAPCHDPWTISYMVADVKYDGRGHLIRVDAGTGGTL